MNASNGSLAVRCMPVMIAFGAILFTVMMAVPATVSADATHPKWVNGFITDIMGNQLGGATVSVTIDGNTKAETADGDGFYQVSFIATEWTVGSNIHVVATYDSQEAWSDELADDTFVQAVDVQYPYEIPQFGGSVGLVVAGVFVAAVSVVLLADNRRR